MIYFSPGPSKLNPNINHYLNEFLEGQWGSISHRSSRFHELYQELDANVKSFLKLSNEYAVLFTSSATEVYERSLLNLSNGKSHHFINGSFSKRWYHFSERLNYQSTFDEVDLGQSFSLDELSVSKSDDMLCFVHSETSTGAIWDKHTLYEVLQQNPNALSSIDIVTSMPYHDIDLNLFDTSFFCVQKATGLPAGLGVWMVNQEVLNNPQVIKKSKNCGANHTLGDLFKHYQNFETPNTPNILDIFLLNKVFKEWIGIEAEKMELERDEKFRILDEVISKSEKLSYAVSNPEHRSHTIVVLEVQGGNKELIALLKTNGIVVGSGYGILKESQIRIALFPAHTLEEVFKLANVLANY